MAYRDPVEGARERAESRAAEVLVLEGRVGRDLLRRLLPADRAALAALRAETEGPAPTALEGWLAREHALARYRDALTGLVGGAPEMEAWLDAWPDVLPDVELLEDPWGNTIEMTLVPGALEGRVALARGGIEAFFAAHALAVPLVPVGHRALLARFTFAGAPLALSVELGRDAQRAPEVNFGLRTTVRRSLPRLALSPETWGHTFPKVLGLLRDRSVGNESFDTFFLVDTDEPEDVALLDESVQAALLRLAHFDVPKLRVEGGLATLRFSYAPETALLDAAVGVLVALREVRPRLRLVG